MAKSKTKGETPSARVQKIRVCYRFLRDQDELMSVAQHRPITIVPLS
jgi:hypothetical protein